MNFEKLSEKKREIDQYRPFPPELVKNLEDWFRVELTYSSNAIEGNTLSRRETALVIEKGLTVGGKTLVEHLEASNHAKALDWIGQKIQSSEAHIGEQDLLKIHELILTGIDSSNAGFYRNIPVRISGAMVVLPNPRKVPELMMEFCHWLKDTKDHPVLKAAEAHYRLVTIHPFVDGNGRTARLLMNMLLIKAGYPMAIIRKIDRMNYLASLEKAQTGGSKDDYLRLIYKSVNRSLDIYLKAAKGESADVGESEKLYKIGEIAKKSGELNSTIRYWTKLGLISVAEVTPAGYQMYAHETLVKISKIHKLKKQRLSLEEIKSKIQ
jgi:Fic family protein